MSYSTPAPPKQKSLWDTLSGHASNLFNKSKELAKQATKNVQKATTPKPTTTPSQPSRVATASPSMTTTTPMRPVSSAATTYGGKKHRRTKRRGTKRKGVGKKHRRTKRRGHSNRRRR
jgi:hypothetical protein